MTISARSYLLLVLCLWIVLELFAPAAVFSDEASRQPPDFNALVQAGRKTLLRLERQAATWTAVTRLPNAAQVVVKIVSTPEFRRTVVSVQLKGRTLGGFEIIAREKLWYVTELGKRKKYRPFEAPFVLNSAYFFLFRGQPAFVDGSRKVLGACEGTKDGVATFLAPLPNSSKKQVEYSIRVLEELARQKPERANDPDSQRQIEQLRRLLRGLVVRIDVATGMFLQMGTPERQTEISEFKWLDQV
jgi:hypothetical protein